jgi:hypothetical protein
VRGKSRRIIGAYMVWRYLQPKKSHGSSGSSNGDEAALNYKPKVAYPEHRPSMGSRRNNFTFWRETRWSIMNRFPLAAHARNRAPSGCSLQENANLFLREP